MAISMKLIQSTMQIEVNRVFIQVKIILNCDDCWIVEKAAFRTKVIVFSATYISYSELFARTDVRRN